MRRQIVLAADCSPAIIGGFRSDGARKQGKAMRVTSAIIDDLSRAPPMAATGSPWRLFTDQVMGGVSEATMVRDIVAGRPAIRMTGDVRLENKGGVVDASGWSGVELDVVGNGEDYGVHLRTDALTRPWQSWRQIFTACAEWRTVQLPFDRFFPYRTDVALDPRRLRRIGVAAIGRAFASDLALGGLRFLP
jgi:hypothetical protein